MIALTENLQTELDRSNGSPLRVIDPRSNKFYVLLEAEIWDKLKAALDDEFDVESAYPLIDEVMREAGWDDPEWESYDEYVRRAKP
jgi:hypothetical protein